MAHRRCYARLLIYMYRYFIRVIVIFKKHNKLIFFINITKFRTLQIKGKSVVDENAKWRATIGESLVLCTPSEVLLVWKSRPTNSKGQLPQ